MALYLRGSFYHYHFCVDGRRYRGSTKQKSLAAARRVEAKLIAEAEQDGTIVVRSKTPTLAEFSKEFLELVESSKLSPDSKKYYQRGWQMLAETKVSSMRLNAIGRDEADVLSFSGGPSNHNNAIRTLRRMLGKAVEKKLIKAAPKLRLLPERERQRVIDAATEAKLLPFCRQPLADVLVIMRDTGMRNRKEVFTMRWEYVDWTGNRYYVYESKTPKGRRWIPLSPRVLRILEKRYAEQDKKARKKGWVFPSKRAAHLTTVAKQFEEARKKAGLPEDVVPYCARHDFGTEMYKGTKNLVAVMKVMGHASIATTMRYQHQDIDEVARVTSQRV